MSDGRGAPRVSRAAFTEERPRLRRMVALRLDPRLQGRLDPSDVLQEAFLEAARRLDEYVQARPMPVFLWVRRVTAQKLADLRRKNLGAKVRDARREVSIHQGPEASSATLAAQLVDQSLAPSQRAARDEIVARVHDALESLDLSDAVSVLQYLFQSKLPHVLGTTCVPIGGCPQACTP